MKMMIKTANLVMKITTENIKKKKEEMETPTHLFFSEKKIGKGLKALENELLR